MRVKEVLLYTQLFLTATESAEGTCVDNSERIDTSILEQVKECTHKVSKIYIISFCRAAKIRSWCSNFNSSLLPTLTRTLETNADEVAQNFGGQKRQLS